MKNFPILVYAAVILFLGLFAGELTAQTIQERVPRQKSAGNDKYNKQGVRMVPLERFRAGEALMVRVYGDSSSILNAGYPINPEGYVNFPILGKVYVIDKTRAELESYLVQQMSNYMKDTHVSVRPAIRVSFLGNFQQPGMRYIHPDEILWDAFLRALGPANELNLKKLHVRRGSQELTLDPLDAFSDGLTLREAGIKSGDIFIIPTPIERKGFWYYFKETVQVTGSLAATALSVFTVFYLFR